MVIKVSGFPGLPAFLDIPKIKKVAYHFQISISEAKEVIYNNPKVLEQLGEIDDTIERRATDCLPIDREPLSNKPKSIS